jgi:hypothetical protein
MTNGDTLPVGSNIVYLFGVFDTGSTIVAINNSVRPNGAFPDTRVLSLCRPNQACQIPTDPRQHDVFLPKVLDVRIWGLGAVDPTTNNAPLDTPQREVAGIQVRPLNAETLIGAPVAARTVALIDYGTTVSRTFGFGVFQAPDITFFAPGAAGIPNPPYRFPLTPHGSFTTAADGASVGPRFLFSTAVFRNGASTATGTNFRILYDTGNVTTQVTEALAQTLGVDTTQDPSNDTMTIGTVNQGDVTVKGYVIDQFELTTVDGMNQHRINNPLIYVRPNRPDGTPPFPDNVDAVIGSNYFWKQRVLFDGPGGTVGLFTIQP